MESNFWHQVVQNTIVMNTINENKIMEINYFTHYHVKSQDSLCIVGSADLCLNSPLGVVTDHSVAEGGAHSSGYCLTATVSIWLGPRRAAPLLPRGRSDRWATWGSLPDTLPAETKHDHFPNVERLWKKTTVQAQILALLVQFANTRWIIKVYLGGSQFYNPVK